jgi:hypothetical protein
MVKLYGKAIRINKASQDKNSNEVGANLFIGNLDPEVDEKVRVWGFGVLYCVMFDQGPRWCPGLELCRGWSCCNKKCCCCCATWIVCTT